MKTLRERETARNPQRTEDSGAAFPSTSPAAFPTPLHATVDGEAVRVVAFGDIPGHSPSYLCVDERGDSVWVSMKNVILIDPNALPIRQLSQSGSTR